MAPPRFHLRRLPGLLEVVLWLVAAVALGTAAWMEADAYLYQHAATEALSAQRAGRPAQQPPPLPPMERVREATQPERSLEPGTPIAQLVVPRLGLSTVVAEGIDPTVLRRAIGRIPSSAYPGERGNVALAGHRDTFLRPIADIREGDWMYLESPTQRFTYRVVKIEIVEPDEMHVLDDASFPALTLITCYPFRYVGPAPQRFVVQARQIAPAPEHAGAGVPEPATTRSEVLP